MWAVVALLVVGVSFKVNPQGIGLARIDRFAQVNDLPGTGIGREKITASGTVQFVGFFERDDALVACA